MFIHDVWKNITNFSFSTRNTSNNIYRPKRSFGQGNIFTGVCHSFCSQGGGIFSGGVFFRGGYFFGGVFFWGGYFFGGYFFPGGVFFRGGGFFTGIRSTFGRYASYWNAFLFMIYFHFLFLNSGFFFQF